MAHRKVSRNGKGHLAPRTSKSLFIFVTLCLVAIFLPDHRANALPVHVDSVTSAALAAPIHPLGSPVPPLLSQRGLLPRVDSASDDNDDDDEEVDTLLDIDGSSSGETQSETDSEPENNSDGDYNPNPGSTLPESIGDYEAESTEFLRPIYGPAAAMKLYLKNWDGQSYKIVGKNELMSQPDYKIPGPVISGTWVTWKYSTIQAGKNTGEVDVEHLVEGQSISDLVRTIREWRVRLYRSGRTTTYPAFKAMMAGGANLQFQVTKDGVTTTETRQGSFERLLGDALNGIGNTELINNPMNTIKKTLVAGQKADNCGGPGLAGIVKYLDQHKNKITNSMNNMASVFEAVAAAAETDPALAADPSTGPFCGKLRTLVETNIRDIYDSSRTTESRNLFVRATGAATEFASKPMGKDLARTVDMFNGSPPALNSPTVKRQKTAAQTSADACGKKSRRSIFARLFGSSPWVHLGKRDSGCVDGYLINQDGETVDKFGNEFNDDDQAVNEDSDLVDENNSAVDAWGNKVRSSAFFHDPVLWHSPRTLYLTSQLDDNGDPRNDAGQLVDSEGYVASDQTPQRPSLRCSGGSSARSCRSKQRTIRKNQKPGSKDKARDIEDNEAKTYSEAKGDVDHDTASTLGAIKTITSDGSILPNGAQGFDIDDPKSVYAGAETLEQAWESVGKSFDGAVNSNKVRIVNAKAIKQTLRAWRRNIAQRNQRQTSQPRDQRDGLQVSESEREASIFNSVLDSYNANEPDHPVMDVYKSDPTAPAPVEAFPDTLGDSMRSQDETASRASLDALREFSDLTDHAILPEGAEGLTLAVDETGAMDDLIDPSQGVVAGAGEGDDPAIATWDDAWGRVASTVNAYLAVNKGSLDANKIRALLRGIKALRKAANSRKGSSNGESLAQQAIWAQAKQIVHDAILGDLSVDKEATDLAGTVGESLLTGGDNTGPTVGMKASHIAEDVAGSMAEAADRLIGDRMGSLVKFKASINARKLARSFKNVFKTIGKNLAKSDKLTPQAKAQLQSNMVALKGYRDEQVNKIGGTPESDRGGILDECEFTLDIHNAYNDVVTDAILGGAQQVMDPSQGVTTDYTSADLPDSMATLGDAIGAKQELMTVQALHGVDKTVGFKDGYDSTVTNSGSEPAISGIGEYVRELSPKEIYTTVADGASVEDAWNAVATTVMSESSTAADFLKRPSFSKVRNSIRRGLSRWKKAVNVREKGQRALVPSERKDEPAFHAETLRANLKDVSSTARFNLGVSGETSPLSTAGSGSTNELTNEDLRSSDTVISVGIVDALQDLKIDGQNPPSGILPGGDIAPSDDPTATVDPPALYNGANSMSDVLQDVTSEMSSELGSNSQGISTIDKIRALRGLGKLSKVVKAARKDLVSAVGREDPGSLAGAIDVLGSLERASNGVADGAERGQVAKGIDLPAQSIEPVSSTAFSLDTPTELTSLAQSHPGSKTSQRAWNARLRSIRNRQSKSATGRTMQTSKGNTGKSGK
ncbi:hypothetical protein HKX48_005930 [Thoreauomyces humboldtii]|nr:hypothetical protein HKX48_005930 [Thoreauomyces humboldtii]